MTVARSRVLPLFAPGFAGSPRCSFPRRRRPGVGLEITLGAGSELAEVAKIASRPCFVPDSTPLPATCQTASSANRSLRVAISPALKAAYPRRTSSTFSAVPMIGHLSVILVGSCWDGSRLFPARGPCRCRLRPDVNSALRPRAHDVYPGRPDSDATAVLFHQIDRHNGSIPASSAIGWPDKCPPVPFRNESSLVRRLKTLVAAAVAVTLLAGCGSGRRTPASSGAAAGPAAVAPPDRPPARP